MKKLGDTWLSGANQEACDLVMNSLKHTRYSKGSFVHRRGDTADGLFFIEQGTVRINQINSEGKELIVTDLSSGEWFGFIGSFGAGHRPNDALANEDSVVCHLSQSDLNKVLTFQPILALNIANILAIYVERYYATYEQAIFMPLSDRLKTLLKQLCSWQDTSELKLTQAELAAMLGVTKEAIGVQLNTLKAEGFIELGYRKIVYKGENE